MMRKVLRAAATVAVVAAAGMSAACGQIGALKGKMAFKEANALYSTQKYEAAAEKYAEALEQGCSGDDCTPPELAFAYFYLGSSHENLYRPNMKDDAANEEHLKKAVEYYTKASEVSPDPTYKKRSLQYLVGVYGPDKLGDPSGAEPIIQRLIAMDPNDATNYYQMAKLYEDSGDFEKAEEQLLKARSVRPDDPDVYLQLSGYYDKRGDFDKQIEALTTRAEKAPDSPEAFYTIANVYWNKACLPTRPQCEQGAPSSQAVKAKYIESGLEAADRALKLRPDYIDALVFKNLLLRSQAYVVPARRDQLINEADQLLQKVTEIRKRQSGEAATQKKAEE
jgi:tetratricopeptide (TPR) repeat protein